MADRSVTIAGRYHGVALGVTFFGEVASSGLVTVGASLMAGGGSAFVEPSELRRLSVFLAELATLGDLAREERRAAG